MKRILVALMVPAIFLVSACGAEAEPQNNEVTYNAPEPDNVTEGKAPVTKYKGDDGMYDVYVFSVIQDGKKCVIASSFQSVAMECDGADNGLG